MPVNKDFKRLVRARMRRTGEAYAAARARLLAPKAARPTPAVVAAATPAAASPDPSQYAALAGFTDAAVKARTGCAWKSWVRALDRKRAWDWEHDKLASYIREQYEVPGWWAQNVAVGYERIKGLRQRGQRRNGMWETTKSRVFGVPLKTLYAAFSQPRQRTAWLPDAGTLGKLTANKYWRTKWPDGSSVTVNFYAKGSARSQLQVQHEKLASKDLQAEMKAFWTERLDALGSVLQS